MNITGKSRRNANKVKEEIYTHHLSVGFSNLIGQKVVPVVVLPAVFLRLNQDQILGELHNACSKPNNKKHENIKSFLKQAKKIYMHLCVDMVTFSGRMLNVCLIFLEGVSSVGTFSASG